MLHEYLSLLPEIFIGLLLMVMGLVECFRASKTPKTFYSISKYFIAAVLFFTIVFYNKSPSDILENTSFTAMIKSMLYILAGVWFFLSCKWFLNKKRASFRFYFLAVTMLLLCSLLISARSFALLAFIFPLLALNNFFLGRGYLLGEDRGSWAYLVFAAFFALLNGVGLLLLKKNGVGMDYETAAVFFKNSGNMQIATMLLLILPWLFLLGAAPFQMPGINFFCQAAIPVYGFINLIQLPTLISVIMILLAEPFSKIIPAVSSLMSGLACLSLFWGALAAGGENNLRRMFAFSNLCHIGIILLCLSFFGRESVSAVMVYVVIYMLTMLGIYTAFLGCKSKGEYLLELSDLNGMAQSRPYVSAAFLVLLFSLLGNPPMLGFIGILSIVDSFFSVMRIIPVIFILCMLCLAAHAYMRVIKSLYFMPGKTVFDRIDKGIYICLLINLMLVIFTVLNPRIVINNINIMLQSVF